MAAAPPRPQSVAGLGTSNISELPVLVPCRQLVCPVCRACPQRTSMFMFRRRRAALVRSLLKARVRKKDDDEVRNLLMKKLNEGQLEDLLRAVETRGGTASCIIVDTSADPAFLTCRNWRWPDLDSPCQLKKLPVCRSSLAEPCCNPFHWSRLYSPESPPPPPYSRFSSERLKPEDRAPSESSQLELRGSLSTNGEEVHPGWCRLAYWELSMRVGRQFPVHNQSVNVFWNLPHGDGLSLRTLAANEPQPPSAVLKARDKIGKGVTLSKEDDGIWAFNRSDCPIFVNSPALDDPDSRFFLVYRVPPGHCLNIYNGSPRAPRCQSGPIDLNSVRISFAKGWGPKYSRQDITACPVWLEILMAPCR
ncbi:unnamed protein product [Nezara viridula]|uniref:Mothers against decapentaplegic homolog n=1 Tax=Nezara viridula TaxID=85310 RepID=A0A9P0MKA1_NEZVI|nr:unnamed protein product [Nezara viridula]